MAAGELVLENDQQHGQHTVPVKRARGPVVGQVRRESGAHRGTPRGAPSPSEEEQPPAPVGAEYAKRVQMDRAQTLSLAGVARDGGRIEPDQCLVLSAALFGQLSAPLADRFGVEARSPCAAPSSVRAFAKSRYPIFAVKCAGVPGTGCGNIPCESGLGEGAREVSNAPVVDSFFLAMTLDVPSETDRVILDYGSTIAEPIDLHGDGILDPRRQVQVEVDLPQVTVTDYSGILPVREDVLSILSSLIERFAVQSIEVGEFEWSFRLTSADSETPPNEVLGGLFDNERTRALLGLNDDDFWIPAEVAVYAEPAFAKSVSLHLEPQHRDGMHRVVMMFAATFAGPLASEDLADQGRMVGQLADLTAQRIFAQREQEDTA